jgi:hypothetical protein
MLFLSAFLSVLAVSIEAHAITNGDIYKHCKKYADRSFEYKDPEDLICLGYFAAVRDFGQTVCEVWSERAGKAESTDAYIENKLFQGAHGISGAPDLSAAIQNYINTMQKYPERWVERPDISVQESIKALAPCK